MSDDTKIPFLRSDGDSNLEIVRAFESLADYFFGLHLMVAPLIQQYLQSLPEDARQAFIDRLEKECRPNQIAWLKKLFEGEDEWPSRFD